MVSLVYNPKETEQRFFDHLKTEHKIQSEDRILVALSGGIDSVTLLSLLMEAQKEIPFHLGACHVHHMIRGDEADRDHHFCRDYCREKNIPFFAEFRDVPKFCKERSCGMEEGARILRYGALEEVANRENFTKIVTAHNADDQCETILFRLFRGTGISGCTGIPERRGRYVRPLLCFSRKEIESYAKSLSLPFISDSSNYDILYSRNRIRHHIMNEAREINPHVEESLLRFCRQAKWQVALLDSLCTQWEEKNKLRCADGKISLHALQALAKSEAGFPILHRALEKMSNDKISIDYERFQAILSLLNRPTSGKIIEISKEAYFSIEKEHLVFSRENPKNSFDYEVPATLGLNLLPYSLGKMEISERKIGNAENFNKNNLIIHLSSDTIIGELSFRNYRSCDQIRMNGMTKKVKKLFCDHGISAHERNRIPLLCDNEGILWIPGIGLCDRARPEQASFHQTISYHKQ